MTLLEDFAAKNGVTGPFDVMSCGAGFINILKARKIAVYEYGFAIITEKVIQELKKYSPILEVGAGTGYWAYEFLKKGLDCVATDRYPCNPEFFKKKDPWTSIDPIDAKKAILKYPNRTLLICWPDYGQTWATEALNGYPGEIVNLSIER